MINTNKVQSVYFSNILIELNKPVREQVKKEVKSTKEIRVASKNILDRYV